MKRILKKLLLFFVTVLLYACSVKDEKDIKIVFTNDIHCGINENVGISSAIGYYKKIDENKSYKALVDAGDFSQGGAEGSISKGELMYQLMNKLGYDFVVPGNHEFDYGVDKLLRNSIELTGVMHCCNFIDLATGKSVFEPYKIMTFGNKKVAFIGICTPGTVKDSSPLFYKNEDGNFIYSFCQEENGEKLFKVIQENIDSAKKEGADYIILVAHVGEIDILYPYDISNIVSHIEGVDAVIDGHTHHVYKNYLKDKNGRDIIVAQTGTKMQNFGVLTIKSDGKIDIELCDDTKKVVDKDVQNIVDEIENNLKQLLDKILYKNNKVLLTTKDLSTAERAIRKSETNLGDFVTDAYRYVGKTDLAVINGGGVREDLKEGDITYNELLKVNPFSNMLCVVKIKGQDFLDYLEFGTKYYPEENGQFVQVSGCEYTIDDTLESKVVIDENGAFVKVDGDYRVKNVLINGEALDKEKEYTLTGINYSLINLGGGASMFKNVEVIQDNFISDVEALEEYLNVADMDKYKNPKGEGRIKFKKS